MNQSNSTIELSSSFQLEIRLGGDAFYLKSGREELYSNYLDKNYNIFQTTRFNHTMIFFKLIDYYKLRDIYISHNNCLIIIIVFLQLFFCNSLSSIVFTISTLIIGTLYCLNYTLVLLHLFMTHLVMDFLILCN